MNIQDLKNRFQAVANTDSAIESFMFDELPAINTKRQKKYPVVLLKTPSSKTDGFSFTTNQQQLEDYTINFYVLTTWTKEDKKTIGLEQRYKEVNKIGDDYLRTLLAQGGNEYYLFDNKTVTKTNGHHLHVDQLVGTQYTFTLRVSNIDNCTI
tara:strand:+ start:2168 stop:2626 length:459 start_codon:yes stop_codon:yes gene_type:complete